MTDAGTQGWVCVWLVIVSGRCISALLGFCLLDALDDFLAAQTGVEGFLGRTFEDKPK